MALAFYIVPESENSDYYFVDHVLIMLHMLKAYKYYSSVNLQALFFQSIIIYNKQLQCDIIENAGESARSRYSISPNFLPSISE